ncbi:amidase [Robiginitalea sp. SC105]|uniref:amidase n=1 Tax=Robiginitalea sp. SC105 TaxID=2762332 RepID=UPI001639D5C3|nr:amidase [Robiginitalea sp. SC105]MBC2838585.1 amidase [Robiginitalea sp. SC105]
MKRRKFIHNSMAAGAALSVSFPLSARLLRPGAATDLTDLSATELSMAIRERQVSCVEVMQAYLDKIHRYNPVYNAIISLADDADLLRQAAEADAALDRGEYRGWMHGMPHAIKDLGPLKGFRYTLGSPMFTNRTAVEDGMVAARIRQQGAIFIGKTNTPEFGLGSQSYNPIFGATGSAYNPNLTAGGSSGGAACGLGTRMLPVADGGDMMGSLRNPGAFNNVIGFRPTTNVVSGEGDAENRLLSTSGPMGRNTRDLIQLLQTLAPDTDFSGLAPLNLNGVRIGWMGDLEKYLPMEAGILGLCEASLKKVADAGGEVAPVQPRFAPSDLWESWTTLRHHGRMDMLEYYEVPENRALLKPELIWEIEQGLGLKDQEVARANTLRGEWYAELDRLFQSWDFLVLPSAQVFPFPKDIHWPKEINGRSMDTYHRWMEVVVPGSLGGIPVINVPVGFDPQGRPMGMQVMGEFGNDRRVIEFALAYEQITTHLGVRPELVAGKN